MKTNASLSLVVLLDSERGGRLLHVVVSGEMEFPGIVPGCGEGSGRHPEHTPMKPKPLLEVEGCCWKPSHGVWKSTLNFKLLAHRVCLDSKFDLRPWQDMIENAFLPGYKICNADGGDTEFTSLFEVDSVKTYAKYFV